MTLRILSLPSPVSPVTAALKGAAAGQSLRAGYLRNKMSGEKAAYLPQALKTAQNSALAKLQGLNINNQYEPKILGARASLLQAQGAELPGMYNARLALMGAQTKGASLKNQAYQTALQSAASNGGGMNYAITPQGLLIVPGSASGAADGAIGLPKAGANSTILPSLGKKSQGKGAMAAPTGLMTGAGGPSSTYTTQGNTLIDPRSGNAISVPAMKTAENIQQSLVGEPNAQDYLSLMYHQVSPELGGFTGPFKRAAGAFKTGFGAKDPAYAAYQAATSSGAINTLDQQLQASGLNKNSSMYEHIKGLVTPTSFDTPETYAMKIAEAQAMLAERTQNNQQFLKGGIPLQGEPGGFPLAANVHQKFTKLIGQHYANQKANSASGFDPQKWESSITSQAQFNEEYRHLSPYERAQVAKIGGQ